MARASDAEPRSLRKRTTRWVGAASKRRARSSGPRSGSLRSTRRRDGVHPTAEGGVRGRGAWRPAGEDRPGAPLRPGLDSLEGVAGARAGAAVEQPGLDPGCGGSRRLEAHGQGAAFRSKGGGGAPPEAPLEGALEVGFQVRRAQGSRPEDGGLHQRLVAAEGEHVGELHAPWTGLVEVHEGRGRRIEASPLGADDPPEERLPEHAARER